ncbi:MAG TPA: DCC1-like thiol-disulfide oxidoreductase family protein [Vicinamibacterales bacterium]|nr:DCC1-like thiol-disulfide oxidoreductase family protein [Vicinamibacterales bacterium]
MVDFQAQAPTEARGEHLVLYDGVCGLCNRLLQFLLPRDHEGAFDYAALQSETGRALVARFGASPDDLTSFYVIADYRRPVARLLARSRASLFVANALGWPWKAAGVLRVFPAALLDIVYDLIARNRYRMFGRYDHCPIPLPEYRSRFID